MGKLEDLQQRHKEYYSDMSFVQFLELRRQKFYPDMSLEEYTSKLGLDKPGWLPEEVKGTGGPPMEPIEALMGTVSAEGVPKMYPAIGGTVGGIFAGIPGAAAGGAIGELGREYVSGEEISPSRIAKEGGLQGVLEGGGRVAGKLIGKALSPSSGHRILPEAREASEYFSRFGGEFSPAQAVEGKLIDLAEGVSEASMTGGPRFFKFRENQAKAFEAVADDLVERIGSSMDDYDIGVLFADSIEKGDKAFRVQASALYKNVDSLTKGATVDISKIREFVEENMKTLTARKGIGGSASGDQLMKRASQLGREVTEEGEVIFNPRISFEEAASIRSGLGEEIAAYEMKKDKAAGIAKKLFSLTDEAMEASAKELGDEAYAAWRKAADFYKNGKATFQSKYMRGILKLLEDSTTRRGAEAVTSQIFKPGRESAIREVKRALKDYPHVWNELRGSFLSKTIERARDADGVIIGKTFTKEIERMGEKTLSEIFTKEELKDIRNVAAIGRISQTRPIGGGSMLIQLSQATAVIGLIQLQLKKSAGAVLLGPWALAKLMTNPTGIRWLTTGLRTPTGTKEAAAITGRIITEIIRSGGADDVQFRNY